jgi:hypothetical protein
LEKLANWPRFGYTTLMVVREEKALYEFERQYAGAFGSLFSYREAALLYEELWLRGLECGAISEANPLEGIEADIEMARVLNGLPKL